MTQRLTDQERLKIARLLAVLDRDAVIGVNEVAVLLNTTRDRIYQASSAARMARGDVLLRLPERVRIIGRRLGWRHGDIRDLLLPTKPESSQGSSGAQQGATASKPIGRPRKA